MCNKILFLYFRIDQICVLYGKYIWEFYLFMKNEKIWRYDILFYKFELMK